MPDFLKKANKRAAAVCEADEVAIAALFIRPQNSDGTKRLGAPGGTLGKMAPLADPTGNDAADADTPASLFSRNAVLVLTGQRLLVFAHGSLTGRVRELVGEVAISDIRAMTLDAPPLGEGGPASLSIEFADGTSISATPGSRRKQFVDTFEELTQPA